MSSNSMGPIDLPIMSRYSLNSASVRSEGYKNVANTVIVHCDVGTLSVQVMVILGS